VTRLLPAGGDARPCALVVDDEPFNVELLVEELADLGVDSVPARDGHEALALIAARDFDIVLLDLMMPGLDGYGVLEQLAAAGRLAGLPVVVVSAAGDLERVSRSIGLGAEDHLLKPFDPVLLRARITGAIEKQRLRDRVRRQLEATRRVFGRYVPEGTAERILAGEGVVAPSLVTATLLYCDIEGFTTLAETAAPATVLGVLNGFLALIGRPIQAFGGALNQVSGDAVLVTYNLPVPAPGHEDRALRTARAIHRGLAGELCGGRRVRVRIGINTGPVVAGIAGAGERLHYTVLGDAVNVAARLEALGKVYGPGTYVSGTTVAGLAEDHDLERLGEVRVRGRSAPVEVWRMPAGTP
jgi:class 3 adenylate cyclase